MPEKSLHLHWGLVTIPLNKIITYRNEPIEVIVLFGHALDFWGYQYSGLTTTNLGSNVSILGTRRQSITNVSECYKRTTVRHIPKSPADQYINSTGSHIVFLTQRSQSFLLIGDHNSFLSLQNYKATNCFDTEISQRLSITHTKK